MKFSWLTFVMLLVLCVIIAALFCIGEVPGGLSLKHPDHVDMLQGRPGIETQLNIKWLGWAFGVMQFCFFICLLALCLNKQGRLKILKKPLFACTLLCITAFCLMMTAYWAFAQEGSGSLFGSFPLPTALMLYALWPMQILFVVIYVIYYDKAIFTTEDEEKFQELLRSQREYSEEVN